MATSRAALFLLLAGLLATHAGASRVLLGGCSWPGHCKGDPCQSDDDCDGDMTCGSNKKCGGSGPAPNPSPSRSGGCSWPGHCKDDPCRSDDDCDGDMTCGSNKKCGGSGPAPNPSPKPAPCSWAGHCKDDPCQSNDDCDGDMTCGSNKKCGYSGPAPSPAPCSWPGHCSEPCQSDDDCDGDMTCGPNKQCGNFGPGPDRTPPPAPLPVGAINSVPLHGLKVEQHRQIFQLTSLFENASPALQYGYIEDIEDGRGYTFGYVGFCTGTGDGYLFIKDFYLPANPNSPLKAYLPALKKLADEGSDSHEGLKPDTPGSFENLVKGLGSDRAWRLAMDKAVDAMYFTPALNLAAKLGLKSALSKGQMYDACINHGVEGAQDMVAQAGSVSKAGGEAAWLSKFLKIRLGVLSADPTWKEAVDRVKVYQQLLAAGDLELDKTASFTVYEDRHAIQRTANGLTVV